MTEVGVRHIWKVKPFDRESVQQLAKATNLPPLLAHLMLERGQDTPEKVNEFLHPALAQLSDPFLLTDMGIAVERIRKARDHDESVLVFGDYDVDGISAAAILTNGLRRYGINKVSCSMPQRLLEGYGLNVERVKVAKDEGIDLIITVDNGISAHEATDCAASMGIDVIITDHHAIDENLGLPNAVAVINPCREPDNYAGRHLCGAGVAFKLSTALNDSPNDLDIAALGTVADIVPLIGENRVIVALGLKHMAKHQRMGLRQLARRVGLKIDQISSENIGFQLGPRINAAGRLDDGQLALNLLLSTCPQETFSMAEALNIANEERREIESAIYLEAVEEIEACLNQEDRSIVLSRRGWHPGVIGIVASRLQRRYHRPVVVIAVDDEGTGRGSGRSGPGFNLVEAFSACSKHFERFGGHTSAAGMTVLEQSIEAFRSDFEIVARGQLGIGELIAEVTIDAIAAFSEMDTRLVTSLQMLEPLGHHNPFPVFGTFGVTIVPESIRILKEQHLKLTLEHENTLLPAIGFNMAERFFTEEFRGKVDVAYTPKFNTWRSETTIQLVLKDISPSQEAQESFSLAM